MALQSQQLHLCACIACVCAGAEQVHAYDHLVLSPGAAAIKPPLPGVDLPGIFQMKTIPDTCVALGFPSGGVCTICERAHTFCPLCKHSSPGRTGRGAAYLPERRERALRTMVAGRGVSGAWCLLSPYVTVCSQARRQAVVSVAGAGCAWRGPGTWMGAWLARQQGKRERTQVSREGAGSCSLRHTTPGRATLRVAREAARGRRPERGPRASAMFVLLAGFGVAVRVLELVLVVERASASGR